MSITNCGKHFPKNQPIKIVEIGVRYGQSIDYMLKNFNIEYYYGIDPYLSYPEYSIDGFDNIIKCTGGDILYQQVLNKYKDFPNVEIIRKLSNDAIDIIPDNSIDVCFIDGNHIYEYVYNDLKNYFPKVKSGGIICGDDYFMRHKDHDILKTGAGYDQKMVYEAVTDFFNELYYQVHTEGSHRGYPMTWYVKKQ